MLLRDVGWVSDDKRMERIWRREGLKVPARHPKRGRLRLNDGPCVRLRPEHAIDVLPDLFVLRGVPGRVRSDGGPGSIAKAVQDWIAAVGAKAAYIAPGSPWENGYVGSFDARLRGELLDGELFHSLREAGIVVES